MKLRTIKALALLFLFNAGAHAARSYTATVANETGLAYDNTYTLNLATNDAASASAQAVYSSATYTSKTFTGGTLATSSITVVSPTALAGVASSNTIRVVSNSLPANAEIVLNGTSLSKGIHWLQGNASSNTAVNIKNAINLITGFSASTPTTTTVGITLTKKGAGGNAYTLAVNTSSLTVTGATFAGGVTPGMLGINGITLREGTDWTAVATASGTAKAISDAIMANSGTNALVVSTWTTGGVIFTTSTAVGTSSNYLLYTSSQAALRLTGTVTTPSGFPGRGASAMTGGTNAAWTNGSGIITVASHGLPTALNVLYSGTPAIGGLTTGTTYFVIPLSANTLALATTKANAIAGTAITLTSSQTATTANTYTLAPLAISGTPSFKWQASNDNTNWTDLSVSSVTMTSYTYGGATSSWDFGTPAYTYFRVNVIAPLQGAISLVITAAGRTGQR